MWWLEWD